MEDSLEIKEFILQNMESERDYRLFLILLWLRLIR